jgi:hypothetical protein
MQLCNPSCKRRFIFSALSKVIWVIWYMNLIRNWDPYVNEFVNLARSRCVYTVFRSSRQREQKREVNVRVHEPFRNNINKLKGSLIDMHILDLLLSCAMSCIPLKPPKSTHKTRQLYAGGGQIQISSSWPRNVLLEIAVKSTGPLQLNRSDHDENCESTTPTPDIPGNCFVGHWHPSGFIEYMRGV